MGEDKWIRLADNPPEKNGWRPGEQTWVVQNGGVRMAWWESSQCVFVNGIGFRVKEVTHYMRYELPDPPKAEVQYACPFCGSALLRVRQAGVFKAENYWVKCLDCLAEGPVEKTEPAAMAHFRKEGME